MYIIGKSVKYFMYICTWDVKLYFSDFCTKDGKLHFMYISI